MSITFDDLSLRRQTSTHTLPIAITDADFFHTLFESSQTNVERRRDAHILPNKIDTALHSDDSPLRILDELTKAGRQTLIIPTVVLKECLVRKDGKHAQGIYIDPKTHKPSINCDAGDLKYNYSKLIAAYFKEKLHTDIKPGSMFGGRVPFIRYYDTVEDMVEEGELDKRGKGGIVILREQGTGSPNATGVYLRSIEQAGDNQIDDIVKKISSCCRNTFYPVISNDNHFRRLARTFNGNADLTSPFAMGTQSLSSSMATTHLLSPDQELFFKGLFESTLTYRRIDQQMSNADSQQIEAGNAWFNSLVGIPNQQVTAPKHKGSSAFPGYQKTAPGKA